ncbi:MAG: adaptor protein MecA [Clostridiales bacterium]|nr:adaptor protein MecA [Clostridiales bacterium]
MKIEKLNENQIRCTLTRQDLETHQIRISELAYGTEKAKRLFREMMQQAQTKFGFEADNIPLMIEAIPVSTDSIILIITKVEDPEELDTRFSKFAPFRDGSEVQNMPELDGADNIIDIFQKLCEAKLREKMTDKAETAAPQTQPAETQQPEAETPPVDIIRMFVFPMLDDIIAASHGMNGFFTGENTLYRESPEGDFQLVIHQSNYSAEDFNRVCNILSEYGTGKAFTMAGEAYLREHGDIITENALQQLFQL